jgi:hypothetical protein
MSSQAATLSIGDWSAGTPGFFECRGYWVRGLRESAHITLLELATVRMSLEEFTSFVGLCRGEVIRLWTDNQVTMYVIDKMVSRSPALIGELRRFKRTLKGLGVQLDVKYLPSPSTCTPTDCRDTAEYGLGTQPSARSRTPTGRVRCKRLWIYRKLGTRVDQRTNPRATYIGFGLSRRSSSTNYRITLEQCQRRQAAPADRRKRSEDHDISNHKYTCWDEHVDTSVQRKRSRDQDTSRILSTRVGTSWLAWTLLHASDYDWSTSWRAIDFVQKEGFRWRACEPGHKLVGYIEYIRRNGTVGAASIAGYVSGVNAFFTKLRLPSPGLLQPGKVHPAVKSAQEGYRRRFKRLNPPPPERPAMPVTVIDLMLASLTAGLGRESLENARALMAPISQFYPIQRPTLDSPR